MTLRIGHAAFVIGLRRARACAEPGQRRPLAQVADRVGRGKDLGADEQQRQQAALELGPHGITANAIGPGPIRTALFDRANPPDAPRTRAIVESVPVKRIGTPDDVAHAASYLLDARSGFVTGQVLYVCGGMTVGVAGV